MFMNSGVEVNSDDQVLEGISRTGFDGFERIQNLGSPIVSPYLSPSIELLPSPVVAGYKVLSTKATDISVQIQFDPTQLGSSTYLKIVDLISGRVVYNKTFKTKELVTLTNISLPVGTFFISSLFTSTLVLTQGRTNTSNVTVDGVTITREVAVGSDSNLTYIDNSYIPMAVAWGTNQAFDYIYNGAIVYLDGAPYSILWVDTNGMHDLTVLVRPERVR
jgi:hypothetical protein